MPMTTTLRVAALGWDHDAWAGRLYPEDLPRDWRLAYYANEFRAVLVPFAYWHILSGEAAARWAEDTDPSFRFFLELPAGAAHAPDLSQYLGERLGGPVSATAGTPPRSPQALDTPSRPWQTPPHPKATRGLPPLAHAPCAQPGEPVATRLTIARLPGVASARAVRERIEALMAEARGCPQAVLVVDGDPPDLALLRQAKAIAELLGY